MSILYKKIEQHKKESFSGLRPHYQTLKSSQSPHTLLVTCADSRLCPQEFTQTQAGELFIIRNAGNLIPPYDPNSVSNEGLTIEYGIEALDIPEIVVCGHASCGAMAGLMDPGKLTSLPLVQKALTGYKDAHKESLEGKDNLEQLIEWNVTNQLHSLMSYPFIQERIKDGRLKVYGIVYDFVEAGITFRCHIDANGEVINETSG